MVVKINKNKVDKETQKILDNAASIIVNSSRITYEQMCVINELQQKNKILQKALELACRHISDITCRECENYRHFRDNEHCDMCENGDYLFFLDNFYSEAEQELEKEQKDD